MMQRSDPIVEIWQRGAGLKLMNIDSRICEYVIADLVRADTPILINHDSLIVPVEEEDRLLQLMKEALKKVTRKKGIKDSKQP